MIKIAMRQKSYFVYIMSNRSKTLYTEMSGCFVRRVYEHKTGVFKGFTSRYRMDRLVYYERYQRVHNAIAREKQLKGWTRLKKIQLIVSMNPTWKDLAEGWYPELKRTETSNTWVLRLRACGAALRMTKHKIHPALRGTQVFAG